MRDSHRKIGRSWVAKEVCDRNIRNNSSGTDGENNRSFCRDSCPLKDEGCVSPLADRIYGGLDQQGMSLNGHYVLDVPVSININRQNHVPDDVRGFRLRRI